MSDYPTPPVPTDYPVHFVDRDPKTTDKLNRLRMTAFTDCATEGELLGQLAWAASMCWSTTPAGVFDSELASMFVELAEVRLKQLR